MLEHGRLAQPAALIDISSAADLDYVREQDGCLAVGAAATQASVEWRDGLAGAGALLAQALPVHLAFPDLQPRQCVRIGRRMPTPTRNCPGALRPRRQVVLRGRRRRRILPAAEFFQGMLMTARHLEELAEEVRFPLARSGTRYAFDEVSARHGDFALVAAAALADAREITPAVGSAADRPMVRRWPRMPATALEAAVNDFAWSWARRTIPTSARL